MYEPRSFVEDRIDVLHDMVRQHSLGTMVAMTNGGLNVDHLPFLVGAGGPFGVLRSHVARANHVWHAKHLADAVIVFQGPQRYITPSWYATKAETGKVVPTWNYVVVHAHGPLRFIEDAQWLRDHVNELTNVHEASRPTPWKASDAPDDYVDGLLGAIVGVEMVVARLDGKWKLGQNRPERDRTGMIDGLRRENRESDAELAALIERTRIP